MFILFIEFIYFILFNLFIEKFYNLGCFRYIYE